MKKSKALLELEELALQEKLMRLPEIPVEWMAQPKFNDNSANSLTQAIIAYIKLIGGQAERISTTGRMINNTKTFTNVIGQTRQIGSAKYIPGTSTKGSADISAIIKTKKGVVIPWKIEIKQKDKQSEYQKKYEQDIIKAGGHYSIVHSFDEFRKQYDDLVND